MAGYAITFDRRPLDAELDDARVLISRLDATGHARRAEPLVRQLEVLALERKACTFRATGDATFVVEFSPEARRIVDELHNIEWQAERIARSILCPPRTHQEQRPAGGAGAVRAFAARLRRPFSSLFSFMARIVRADVIRRPTTSSQRVAKGPK